MKQPSEELKVMTPPSEGCVVTTKVSEEVSRIILYL